MKGPITNYNIKQYVLEEYNTKGLIKDLVIKNIYPLLQDNFGEVNDCTLTSITTAIKFFCPLIQTELIYSMVEMIAKQYFYTGEKGTNPIFMSTIYTKVLKYFDIKKKAKGRYLKNIGFNYNFIQDQIKLGNPILLNISKDGRDYYKNHTVLIIGYAIIENIRFLIVFDNWHTQITYIDYEKLSTISSINYLI